MADRLPLRALQERFFALVSRPETDVAGALSAFGLGPDGVAFARGDDKLDAIGRLDVYADMYVLRLVDALAEDYPRTKAALDALDDDEDGAGFLVLARGFLSAFPPRSFTLRRLGAGLPGFLAAHPAHAPWIADLAALEWARADIFDRAEVDLLTLDSLRTRPADSFVELPLVPVPAFELVTTRFEVSPLWRRLGSEMPGAPPAEPASNPAARPPETPPARPECILVWRQGTEVFHRPLAQPEAELAELLAAGTTFGAVCERLAAEHPDEAAARLAFEVTGGWVESGLLRNP